MKYKVILFDADRTLFDYDKAQENALKNTYNYLNLDFNDNELQRYRVINDQLWSDLEKGIVNISTLKTERFKMLFEKQEFDYQAISDFYLYHLGEGSFEIEGAQEVCEVLSKKYQLVILTNGMTKVQHNRIAKSNLQPYISDIITSEETGYNKPDKAIFEHTLNKIGHGDKKSVLMIGDSLTSDIKGGINAGIDTCWYNSEYKERNPQIIPTYEIKVLKELLALL